MLKAMRKNLKSLAPTLWLVIAAFVIAIFAVWGGGGSLGEGRPANTIARVGKAKISIDSYYQNLRQRLESMKREFKDLNRKLIQQLGIPQQILEQMIQQKLLLQAARELGISASADEISQKIMSFPVFQREGKFIGVEEYRKILEWNRTSVEEFERALREEIIIEKVIDLLTAHIAVTEEEVWKNFKNENESVRLEYLVCENDKIELKEDIPEEELRKYFKKNKDRYKIPEKREGEYIFFNTDDLKEEVAVDESEIEKYYRSNRGQFEEPEKIRVRRVFLAYKDKEKEEVRAEAEELLKKVKKGEGMDILAEIYSEDEKAKDQGDWGYYDWKRLSEKEKETIENLAQGELSPLLELEDGVSFVMVTEKNPPRVKPLEQVREQITTILREEKARTLGEERIKKLEKEARKEKSLDVAAQKNGLKIKRTGLLASGDAIEDIDPSGNLSQTLFSLEEQEISSPFYTYKGVGLSQLIKIEPSRLAKFEEVKDKIREDALGVKKKEKALEMMNKLKNKLRIKSMEKVAEKNEAVEYKTAEEHKRGQYLSVIGENSQVDNLAFSLPLERVSDPVEFDNGYALLRILERKTVSREDFEKEKKKEKEKLLERKRNSFLHSYLAKLRQEKGVKIRYNLFVKVNSDVLSRFGSEEGETR
ncbi:MAG: SurA N-terminal domain-containing protein [Candidatus Aminicenantales bacterium]